MVICLTNVLFVWVDKETLVSQHFVNFATAIAFFIYKSMQRFGSPLCQNKKAYMFRFILSLLFLFLTVVPTGCKKEKAAPHTAITGTWELTLSQSGMIPSIQYAPGNGNTLVFSESTYQQYENNTLVASGPYSTQPDNSVSETVGLVIPSDQYKNRIVFEGSNRNTRIFYHISGDTLSFLSGYFPLDGGSITVYKRIH